MRRQAANDNKGRADCGLPEDAFVFCAFNNPEKFNRPAFDAWMKILAGVPGSVLWVSKVKAVPEQVDMLVKDCFRWPVGPFEMTSGRTRQGWE